MKNSENIECQREILNVKISFLTLLKTEIVLSIVVKLGF